MKMLGLDIRKSSNVKTLYETVDLKLAQIGCSNGESSANIKIQTVQHKLTDMFKASKHFNICAIKDLQEITNVHISSERNQIYRAAHCISWSDMTPEYRDSIIAMVLDDFRDVLVIQDVESINLENESQ